MEGKTVLLIEDNELNLKLIRTVLAMEEFEVLEAKDAERGIELAREHKPDLILMDIQLPGLDGLSATRLIKGDPDLREIPVIALTSYAMHGDEEKAREAGCTGYIAKPIDTRNFKESITELL
jgi:CheY-like chemotaxis protein